MALSTVLVLRSASALVCVGGQKESISIVTGYGGNQKGNGKASFGYFLDSGFSYIACPKNITKQKTQFSTVIMHKSHC